MADPVALADPLNAFFGLLHGGLLSDLRQDNAVARQGVMDHQKVSSTIILQYVNQMTSMDITESYAIQGLAQASGPRDAAAWRGMGSIPERDLGSLMAILASFGKNG